MHLKHTLIASALMLLTVVCLGYLSNVENTPLHKPFSTFPKQIGEWAGIEKRFDHQVYDVLGVDDSFLGTYQNADGRQVQLYVGFYESQRKGDLIHSPKHCMPGAGWNITSSSPEKLIIQNSPSEKIIVNKLILKKGSEKLVAFYWYQSRGRFITSEYMQKIYLVIDSITRHRTDGSFVRLVAPVVTDDEAAAENLKSFAKLLIPILQQYLPS